MSGSSGAGSGTSAGAVRRQGPSLVSHVLARHGDGLDAALERLVEPFGGWSAVVAPGERVAVKVNLLRAAPPAQVSTYAYVNPVIAVFLGWLLADELLNARIVTATVIIVAAVAIITIARNPRH